MNTQEARELEVEQGPRFEAANSRFDVERILHQSAEAVFALLHFAVLAQQFLDAFEKAGFQLIFNTK